ncbi:hypothetical protein QO002_003409 [Pararhizobium capsulatum DSM 1112]|uniref:Uncharacterized protein n=1 Tax=Pararhizobium capsulatum DSM 1112 TaxID=1121113 RepID=A0ABU0BSN2_9HYPH|nr:hypothetical protein [Pararhizobium capsulatum DSM 1112]
MPDLDNENDQTLILKPAEDSKVSDPITPEISKFRALQRLTQLPGIIHRQHPAIQKVDDALGVGRAYFLQAPFGDIGDFNRPGQVLS